MKSQSASDGMYDSLIEQLPDIVYKINKKGCFTYVSHRISMLGYEPAQLIGKHFSSIIHNDYVKSVSSERIFPKFKDRQTGDIDSPKLFDERRAEPRGTINLEIPLLYKNKKNTAGEPVYIDALVSANGIWEKDEQGKKQQFLGTVGIIRDIGAIKERQARETYVKGVLSSVKDVLKVLNQKYDMTEIGHTLCNVLNSTDLFAGVSFALLNEKVKRILPLINDSYLYKRKWSISPEGSGYAPECVKRVFWPEHKNKRVIQGGVCNECEYCSHGLRNNVVTLKIISDNKIIGILIIQLKGTVRMDEEELGLLEEMAVEISFAYTKFKFYEAVQAKEKEYRGLVENLNEGIWVIDKVYNTTFVNNRMAEMLDYTKEELLGNPILKFLNTKDKRDFWIYLKQCIMGVKKQYDCRLNRKKGKWIYALVDASPVIDNDNMYKGLILCVVDITRRKQIERSLIKKNRMLNRFNNIVVQRELKMIELKKEINSLLALQEKELKYRV